MSSTERAKTLLRRHQCHLGLHSSFHATGPETALYSRDRFKNLVAIRTLLDRGTIPDKAIHNRRTLDRVLDAGA
jgi:hypothetical protein